ncbi:hypothetical protein AFAEC_2258 [Aliarcobacter faecis]|uniref:hypothetical protein n=1 Tax=Aliarcobacter faecis TaxID=1564138 RepID=UPI00047CE09B|nr:hypothetical protein [Aliarcobacter faecis]QKF74400.1 hypothetical protein AFAEC_2258 [Aliarcobacter faecis]
MVIKFKRYFTLILTFSLFPIMAFSHGTTPTAFLVCKYKNESIVCVSGYSNGSHAKGNKISLVKVENNEVLEKKVFDKSSKVVFENIPKDDFYILMQSANGKSSIEVGKTEILE